MEKKNLTLEQRAKEASKSKKSQAWKVAVVSALGLTAGASSVYAYNHYKKDDEPVVEEDKKEEEVTIVPKASTEHHASHTSAHAAKHESHDDDVQVALPKYFVYEQEIITQENGSQIEVAYGLTDKLHDCVLVDDDLDGKADRFIEDVNGDGVVETAETIDLAQSDIHVSMDNLPELAYVEEVTVTTDDTNLEAYVVDDDPNVNIDSDDQIDAEIDPEKEMSDITSSYDMASTDDTGADATETFMA